jgi:taurine transport system permease protein
LTPVAAQGRQSISHRLASSPTSWKLGTLVMTLGLWQLLGPFKPIILSYPTQILASAWQLGVVENKLLPAFTATLQAFAVGVLIATALGIALGFLMGRSSTAEVLLKPYVFALYATPRIALVPLLVLWFGIGFEMRVVVVILSAMFPIAVNAYQGARYINPDYDETARSFVASRMQSLRTVVIPATVPYVFAGLRIGVIRGLVGVIVAEMTAAVSGTGRLLIELGRFFQTNNVLVPTILLGVLGILLVRLLDFVQHKVAPWSVTEIGART